MKLPEQCLVNKKITKAFFKRNFDLTTSERNLLDDFTAIVTIDWIASISLHTANVPTWSDADTTFEEVQVICAATSSDTFEKNAGKIIDLVQKYIPYHMLLVVSDGGRTVWNVTYKRINQNDDNKRTIATRHTTPIINEPTTDKSQLAFLDALSFARINTASLKTLFDGYVQCIVALTAAAVTGSYTIRTMERTQQDVAYMNEIDNIEKDILLLNNQAKKETQMNKRIDLNNKVQQKRKQMEQIKQLISA